MNNQTEENNNLEDNPTIENSVEVVEIDFPPDNENQDKLQKIDDDEYAP